VIFPDIGDAGQLEEVLLNLISNARDAMDETKGEKVLTISSSYIEEDGSPYIRISVKDTGIGIPEENKDKILEPFSAQNLSAKEPAWVFHCVLA